LSSKKGLEVKSQIAPRRLFFIAVILERTSNESDQTD